MFTELFNKIQTFESHHQILFAFLAALGLIFFTWGIEQALAYFLSEKQIVGSTVAIIIGLLILWITKYAILQVM